MEHAISSKAAQSIVNVLKDTINFDITFMDTDGRIIACSNEARIGSVHEGALALLRSCQEKLVINYDGEYDGALKGVNMVLHSHGRRIGVVGVTGNREDVEKYGALAKKMTELLLLEDEYNEHQQRRVHSINVFLQQWLFQRTKVDESFKKYGLTLGINIDLPRMVAVCRLANLNDGENAGIDFKSFRSLDVLMRELLGSDYRNIWFANGNQLILLLAQTSGKRYDLIQNIRRSCQERLNMELYFGYGMIDASSEGIQEQYKQARKALRGASAEKPICCYSDIDIELLIQGLPDDIKSEYLKKMFSGARTGEIDDFCQLIGYMAEYNGSISEIASRMNVHKNTIQYRIHKMQAVTGYDCRNLKDFSALYLACLINSSRKS